MIRKLKLKFILLSTLSLFLLLSFTVAGMNIINYNTLVAEADELLALISTNDGSFPGFSSNPGNIGENRDPSANHGTKPEEPKKPSSPSKDPGNRLPQHLSPETPYESRYFYSIINANGEIVQTNTSSIASVGPTDAENYAKSAYAARRTSGFEDSFRYLCSEEGDGVRIVFLDCGRKLDAFRNFLFASIMISVVGFCVISLIICILAGRIVRPIAESYEKQKRFITDAGHEIKTPLTIINANLDLLEMEIPDHESLSDIRVQTERLTELTGNLVFLAKMEEHDSAPTMIEFPLSEAVEETADLFSVAASGMGKTITCSIQPMISFNGDDSSLRRMVSILLDNALKYSPRDSEIRLSLSKQNKNIVLTVHNKTDFPVDQKDLSRVFERFYRTDPSRNSSTGGHGIGLSIAQAVTQTHGGRISASTDDGKSFCVTVILPA